MLSEERLEELVAWRPGAKTDILAATREEWQDIARELREARAKLAALEAKLAAVLERLSCAEIDELCCVWGTPAHHRTDDGEPLGTEEFYRAVANALVQSRAKGVDDGK